MTSSYEYVDGVGNVSVVNGMAHIDLVVVRPPAAEGQQGRIEAVHHFVMALPQFVRFCADMGNHLHRMAEKGLIKIRPADAKDGAAAGVPPASPAAVPASAPAQAAAPAEVAPPAEPKRRGFFGRG